MANKKSVSSAKKMVATPKAVKSAKTTTKVTTVKAVEAGDARPAAASTPGAAFANVLRTPITGAGVAEFIGTFLLVTLALIVNNQALPLFFVLVGAFMLVGGLSGAHLNPAVTIGAWATRRIGWTRAVTYIVAQFLGAMLALVVMNAFIGQAPEVTKEAAAYGQAAPQLFKAAEVMKGKEWAVLAAEVIGVAVLGFAYASVLRTRIKDKLAGALTIGGSAFIALLFASTVTGYVSSTAALNPASAVAFNAIHFSNIWTLAIYIVAPIVGAVIGFFLHDLIRTSEE